jgi:hypothetical protein
MKNLRDTAALAADAHSSKHTSPAAQVAAHRLRLADGRTRRAAQAAAGLADGEENAPADAIALDVPAQGELWELNTNALQTDSSRPTLEEASSDSHASNAAFAPLPGSVLSGALAQATPGASYGPKTQDDKELFLNEEEQKEVFALLLFLAMLPSGPETGTGNSRVFVGDATP